MINRVIQNKQLRKLMDNEGLQEYGLAKGEGYFYIVSLPNASEKAVNRSLEASPILVYAFNRQSIEEWVEDIKKALDTKN